MELGLERSTYARWEQDNREPELSQRCDTLSGLCHKMGAELVITRSNSITSLVLDKLDNILRIITTKNVTVSRTKRHKAVTDPNVTQLSKHFRERYEFYRKHTPPVNHAAWGSVMKRLLGAYTPRAIEGVIEAFFQTPGRTKTSIYDFERAFPNVYGYLFDKASGKRE